MDLHSLTNTPGARHRRKRLRQVVKVTRVRWLVRAINISWPLKVARCR